MWKQRKSLKSCWCLPRKVINIYSEKESSAEKIVKNKKKKRIKSSFSKKKRNKNIKKVMKHMKRVQRLSQPKIITQSSKQEWNSVTCRKTKKRTSPPTVSKRVMELALPKNLTTLNDFSKDVRDPFKVRPSALKAICSLRTKLLARPKYVENSFGEPRNSVTP
ncbi:uncharacterized protein LOC122637711 isoform X1 [Vespula pensylvanica]|nr:uncharacterized protein LOC122637711 isoform X1 [Vespula pensylvanica]XP_043685972.1 uncharacterized protein LOC122637711 isoform X1 [Vespula pensylvanica]